MLFKRFENGLILILIDAVVAALCLADKKDFGLNKVISFAPAATAVN